MLVAFTIFLYIKLVLRLFLVALLWMGRGGKIRNLDFSKASCSSASSNVLFVVLLSEFSCKLPVMLVELLRPRPPSYSNNSR